MTPTNSPTQQIYPKRHLLAASGIAALLCLTLLIYPSRSVEAKKTFINIELEADLFEQLPDQADLANNLDANADADSNFFEYQKDLTVKRGETLSILFERAGLGNSLLHSILANSKEAKQFTQLKAGQKLTFEFDDNKELTSISSKLNNLESIYLEKPAGSNNFTFRKDVAKQQTREQYAKGVISGTLFSATKKANVPDRKSVV